MGQLRNYQREHLRALKDLITSLQHEISTLKNNNSIPVIQEDLIENIIYEINDRKKREANLLIRNLPESEAISDDKNNIKKVLAAVDVSSIQIPDDIKIIRLGKPRTDNKPRPVKVVFRSPEVPTHLLRKAKNLHNISAYKNIYLQKDLTVRENDKKNKILTEFRTRHLNGDSAICALNELFKSKETHELCKQQFPDLFSILYISLASYINTSAPVYSSAEKKASAVPNRNAYKLNPFKLCLDTFKIFLQNANSKQASASLLLCNDSLSSFLTLVPDLTNNICSEYPQSLAWLVACLGPYIRSELEPQRVAVTALYASLLKHKVNNQSVLAENVLEMVLDVHTDKSCSVRKLSLRGLGYAAEYLNPDLVLRHCNNILDALMQGLDYNSTSESEVALESMLSFSKLIKISDSTQLGQCQITASVRIKPLLQHDSAPIREAAFLLFGDLASSMGTDDAFKEQVHGNLVTLLLHLCDEDPNVVKACKYTMRKIGPFLDCPKVNTLIQEHLLEDGLLQFTQFCMDFVKSMSENKQESFPQLIMICLSFFKSIWTDIRANSALLSGLLYSQTQPEFRSAVSLDTLSYRLLQLLKDGEAEVRARASEALAYIFTT